MRFTGFFSLEQRVEPEPTDEKAKQKRNIYLCPDNDPKLEEVSEYLMGKGILGKAFSYPAKLIHILKGGFTRGAKDKIKEHEGKLEGHLRDGSLIPDYVEEAFVRERTGTTYEKFFPIYPY